MNVHSLLWCAMMMAAGAAGQPANLPLRELSPGVFQLGAVRIDKEQRSATLPAEVNMTNGLAEYFLVSGKGKTYESVLKTDAEPYDLQLAMLLLGAKGAPPTATLLNAPSVPFHVNRPAGSTNPAPAIIGDPVVISLRWRWHGTTNLARAEDWLTDLDTKTNAAPGPWTYNGSRVLHGIFIAQRDGQVIALIDDIDAMVNNPRTGHDNDQIWQINSKTIPPLHVPVEVTLTLPPLNLSK